MCPEKLNPETPADPGSAKGRFPLWLLAPAGLAVLLLLAANVAVRLWPRPTPPPSPHAEEEADPTLTVVNPGYVGIETCAQCHAARAAEFKTTRHYVACTLASGVKSPGFEPSRGRYDTSVPGLHFEMTRSGDDFLATAVQATFKGPQRTAYKVGLVYGSGNTRDELYFAWEGDRLLVLPVAWLYPYDRWGDVGDAIGGLHAIDTPPSCLECHNTWVAHVPGTPPRYRRDDMLVGVTCERCHGPGREHTAYHREHPNADAHAILHPGTLSRERLMDLCAQCHGDTRPLRDLFSYRPGRPLEEYYQTRPRKYREDNVTTNQVQYLRESKCFQRSTMTCVTCHNPHLPTSPRTACVKCHAADSCPDRPRQPAAVRDDCVGCHMPQQFWMNSHYYQTADDRYLPVAPKSEHRIAIYPEARQAVILAWLRKQDDAASRAEAERLAAGLTDHWLNQAEQPLRDGRFRTAISAYREALQITPEPTTRRKLQQAIANQAEVDSLSQKGAEAMARDPDEAIRLLTRLLEIKPDDSQGHSRLGTVYAITGRRAAAVPHLEAVIKCDPSDASGLIRLAWMAQGDGRPEQAEKLCAQAEEVEPADPDNHYVWGLALSKQRRWQDAESHLCKSLERNPAHVKAVRALCEVLQAQGRGEEAAHFVRRAVASSDPNDARALFSLAEAYVAANRLPEARRMLERALEVAEVTDPTLAGSIRQRLRQVQ
jgi:tetratricopeptide (TPR) repeat protein